MLFTLASLLDETKKLLFRPSLECIMESMLWYRIYPSQAHQWCFKWHPPVFKGLYHAKDPFCLSASRYLVSIIPLVSFAYLFPLRSLGLVLTSGKRRIH